MKQYTANDYGSRAVKAAHRVLIELTQVLGPSLPLCFITGCKVET